MKTALIAAAFAALAATPVLAQQGPHPHTAWDGPRAHSAAPWHQHARGEAYMTAAPGAMAYAPGPYGYEPGAEGAYFASGTAVVNGGKIIGQDPDPSIRAEFQRNAEYYLRSGD